MSSYLYGLPTTGAISFADICLPRNEHSSTDGDAAPAYSYISEIAETTEARANLRAVLKENRRTDSEERDYLRIVKVRACFVIPWSYPMPSSRTSGTWRIFEILAHSPSEAMRDHFGFQY